MREGRDDACNGLQRVVRERRGCRRSAAAAVHCHTGSERRHAAKIAGRAPRRDSQFISTSPITCDLLSVVARLTLAAVSLAVVVTPLTVRAQQARAAAPITAAEIDATPPLPHLRPARGARAGHARRTARRRVHRVQLRAAGSSPAVNGSYFQRVPIDIVGARAADDPAPPAAARRTATLRYPDDVVIWAGIARPTRARCARRARVRRLRRHRAGVQVGRLQGRWTCKGKILLVLVNDPPAPAAEPALFGGKAMTYYGRWTYKFEEAERQGAAGVLDRPHHRARRLSLAHGRRARGPRSSGCCRATPTLPRAARRARLDHRQRGAARCSRQAGLDLAALRRRRPRRATSARCRRGITIDLSFREQRAHLHVAERRRRVRGRDPKLEGRVRRLHARTGTISASGRPVNGDSIYNGAVGQRVGRAPTCWPSRAPRPRGPRPKRSMLFVFVTAEESGLLGSEYFAQHPTVPQSQIVAEPEHGRRQRPRPHARPDVLGDDEELTRSDARGDDAGRRGCASRPTTHPERGALLPLGPLLLRQGGSAGRVDRRGQRLSSAGRRDGGAQQDDDYTAHRYHQPSDQYRPDFDLSGRVAAVADRPPLRRCKLANAPAWPTWSAGRRVQALGLTAPQP